MAQELREKCAVAGIVEQNPELPASFLLYDSLFAMQHRGMKASGMVSELDSGALECQRLQGVVEDVYAECDLRRLSGSLAIGHNRYSTSGSKEGHLQPFVDEAIGFAFAHNGNLPVTDKLQKYLEKHSIKTSIVNDSEMMGLAIAQHMRGGKDLPEAVAAAYPLFEEGSFSCVAMHDGMVVAFRDPHGIRPLARGRFNKTGRIVASETCALDVVDATYECEVNPGELVVITEDGVESQQLAEGQNMLDMFEMVYFARRDSMLYGQRVDMVRRRFGEQLAEEHKEIIDGLDLDNIVVSPVPETSIPAAHGFADALGLKYVEAIVKNPFASRTFMGISERLRNQQHNRKLSIIPEHIKGKDLIIVDDSIVRLETLPAIVHRCLRAGAKTLSILIGSPPIRYPDFYGIDTPDQSKLAAANLTPEQIRQRLDIRYLGYLSLSRMIKATNLPANMYNLSCFNGEYPIDIGEHRRDIHTPVSMEYID